MFKITYFSPCDSVSGVGGSARFSNMLDVLQSLGYSTDTVIYRNRGADVPTLLKSVDVLSLIAEGLKRSRSSRVIFAHAPTIVSGFPALVAALLLRKPLIIDHMDKKDPITPTRLFNLILRKATLVLTISQALESQVTALGGKAVYLPPFVDTEVFEPLPEARERIRRNLGISPEDTVIGYCGSFWHTEDLPLLLSIFSELVQRYKVHLLVIGGDNTHEGKRLFDGLSPLAKSRLHLVGFVPYSQVPSYLSACDIACAPKTDCEENRLASPIKVCEYMAMGLPVVASAIGGIKDTIRDGVDGLLVRPGNYGDLYYSLLSLVGLKDRQSRLGDAARMTAVAQFSKAVVEHIVSEAVKEVAT